MFDKEKLVLYNEYPKHLCDRWDIRLYTTYDEENKDYLLSTDVYWGNSPWTEIDGFRIWWLPIITKDLNDFPKSEIKSRY